MGVNEACCIYTALSGQVEKKRTSVFTIKSDLDALP